MKAFPALLVLAPCFLGSCAPYPDAGLYASRRGEMLRISRSGHLEWSPLSKTNAEFQSIGILARPNSHGDRHLVTASAHPLLGSSVQFSPDGQIIDVTWHSFATRPVPKRETRYRKQEPVSKF
jgi:hypothetical protein